METRLEPKKVNHNSNVTHFSNFSSVGISYVVSSNTLRYAQFDNSTSNVANTQINIKKKRNVFQSAGHIAHRDFRGTGFI